MRKSKFIKGSSLSHTAINGQTFLPQEVAEAKNWTRGRKRAGCLDGCWKSLTFLKTVQKRYKFHTSPVCTCRYQLRMFLETAASQRTKMLHQVLRWGQGTPLASTVQTGKATLRWVGDMTKQVCLSYVTDLHFLQGEELISQTRSADLGLIWPLL